MAQSPQLKHSSPTSPDPQDFRLDATPAMRADNVVSGEHWRIGLITDSLVRFEWSDSGVFENRPTQTVLNRDFGSPVERRVTERDGRVIIDTAALTIVYDQQPFSKEGLSVVVKGVADTQFNTWHYGDAQRGNLKGTARTLDEADGAIELDNGVISRDGWAVIDDSAANIIIEADTVNGKANPFGTWVSPRATAETDLYFFGYGHRYIEAVRDFYRLTGPTPLLPRFAMGNWWSRYYRYTQDGYLALMDRFKREGIPFTTSVIDMDWHRVDDVDPKYGSGWTGYSWNRELFPDPPAFLADLHRRGLRTTLNVHPRDGVRAFEDAYPEVAKRVGIDPATEENVEFDLTNPDFVDAYFDMHHRMEAEGVDFWWLDWQQGGVTRQKGLDPLWMLNHMHYLDSGRGGNWPLTFSRYAGPGSHRYPVGFSGDTIVTWESLAFQPQFTATASNIGYGWWSHDIGGHMFGYRNEELEARWYQLGAFSPINRLHSSNSPFSGKEPWNFNRDVSAAMVDALRLRHAMMPYLYTMNYRAAEAGRPLVEPMYWQNPDTPDAYEVPDEFRFGTELVVAPIVSPDDAAACRGRAAAWLPQGEWFDFFDGRRYVSSDAAGRRLEVWRSLDRMPVFAKAGDRAVAGRRGIRRSDQLYRQPAGPARAGVPWCRRLVRHARGSRHVGRHQRRHRDSVHVGRGRCVAQRLHRRAGYRRYVRRTRVARLDGRVPRRRAGRCGQRRACMVRRGSGRGNGGVRRGDHEPDRVRHRHQLGCQSAHRDSRRSAHRRQSGRIGRDGPTAARPDALPHQGARAAGGPQARHRRDRRPAHHEPWSALRQRFLDHRHARCGGRRARRNFAAQLSPVAVFCNIRVRPGMRR